MPVTIGLIVANGLVFLAMLWHGAGLWHAAGLPLAWGANFGPATKDGEWWRLGSAMFLHFGLFHLAMNMLSLWDGGRLVERMVGPFRMLALYFTAGLMGNLLSLFAQGDQAVSAGASGAIFGVYGALISLLWFSRRQHGAREHKHLFWGAILFSVLAIGLGYLIKGIDNYAHMGGLAGGLLMGLVLAPSDSHVPRPASRLAGAVFALAMALMVANMPAPPYRWSEEQKAREEIIAFLGTESRLSAQWQQLMDQARQGELSFDQLAGQIESQIATPYENSFEQLSRLHLDPAAPSASTLAALRHYTESRRDISRALAEGLRTRDPGLVSQSLEQGRQGFPTPTR
jgi:rhomboid protease GluP